MESQGLLPGGAETPSATGYTKVIGAFATGAVLVCSSSAYFSSSTQAELNDARFEIVVDHTLDGTSRDNMTCICDDGYEADANGNECQEIDPCADDNTNNCHGVG